MSRIGKVPVEIPEKVEVKVNGAHVAVKGPKGQLEYTFTDKVTISLEDKSVVVKPVDESKESRSLWGTTRTLVNNMVTGVSEGFTRTLEFNGVGYKAAVSGGTITLNLGYSHPIDYVLPTGVEAKVNKNVIDLTGCDKELVGFAAAKIRSFRPPEPYKGKGVKYSDETIIRKAGKAGSK
ncbi:50S ribosomal protein L6 [Halobacteriovorax marinus]|uniref:Large ribosomal subunit protein uL6 n=1 Tax=Halobacteriovorax marinus (strain ATCC BAA-682 / DSM 15412 / SJ) TaxID=862908 RepID=E1X0K7_HALMS|nr:50S ribosomal protein L6 [Halobacteriovorax marinus]ATH09293.1 50S ribosomal protein L6 [Halobacteriovorax marinus]CBW28033.1 50S ribosomal protein L6 [Halobacteriovorax marinus SJ]